MITESNKEYLECNKVALYPQGEDLYRVLIHTPCRSVCTRDVGSPAWLTRLTPASHGPPDTPAMDCTKSTKHFDDVSKSHCRNYCRNYRLFVVKQGDFLVLEGVFILWGSTELAVQR